MSKLKKIKVGGVPEHFNYPWHQAIKNGTFKANGIDLIWNDFPGGTGQMSEALANEEIDLAIMLTEGSIKQICDGLDLRIVQKYVDSPLLWGIYVDFDAKYSQLADLEDKTVAISREGSGSHLMAYVNAKNENWDTQQLKFVKAQHLDGAVKALQNHKADYFMWEHFTTKPLVDKGVFKHLADCPTPWPCFVIVAKQGFIEAEKEHLNQILEVINSQTLTNKKHKKELSQEIAKAYGLKLDDVEKWMSKTRWSQNQITEEEIKTTLNQLKSLELVTVSGEEVFF